MNEICPFCNIINKTGKAHIVCETENIIAFLAREPINAGHVLVVPKIHCSQLDELPEAVVFEIIATVRKILTALKQAYDFPGYSIMQNGGKFCDFGHLHMHIFPRYEKDGFGWTFGEDKSEFYCAEVANKIKCFMEN